MNNPRVLISVLNWNNADSTINCIKSIRDSGYDGYDIVLVDNSSSDNSVLKISEAFPEILIITCGQNRGYARGHLESVNMAIKGNYQLLWLLNNDVIVMKNTLELLVNAFIEENNALYGSLSFESDGKTIRYGGGYEFVKGNLDYSVNWNQFGGATLKDYSPGMSSRQVSDLNGASLMVPVNIIEKHGFMPLDLFLYAEETYYCYRLREEKSVPSIIVPESTVIHEGSSSFKGELLQWIQQYYRRRNDLLFQKTFLHLKNGEIWSESGGLSLLLKFLIQSILFVFRILPSRKYKYYFSNLALIHAIINRKGKVLKPEKYI